MDGTGTPQRDQPDPEDFAEDDATISEQQGEKAPGGAHEGAKDGGAKPEPSDDA